MPLSSTAAQFTLLIISKKKKKTFFSLVLCTVHQQHSGNWNEQFKINTHVWVDWITNTQHTLGDPTTWEQNLVAKPPIFIFFSLKTYLDVESLLSGESYVGDFWGNMKWNSQPLPLISTKFKACTVVCHTCNHVNSWMSPSDCNQKSTEQIALPHTVQ